MESEKGGEKGQKSYGRKRRGGREEPLLGSLWSHQPRSGLTKPCRLSQGWLPGQGHVEVVVSPEVRSGLVEKEETEDLTPVGTS